MIAIVDYRAGNLTSVKRALDHLGIASVITSDPAEIRLAERIIFPGVGHAATAMAVLRERGLDVALRAAFASGTPILGTCIGAQVILTHSEEGDTQCLGLIAGDCGRFRPDNSALKVPHMGWNEVTQVREHAVLRGIPNRAEFYFVHSYYLRPVDAADVYATSEHGITFPAIVGSRNLVADAVSLREERAGRTGDFGQLCGLERINVLSKRLIGCLDVRNGRLAKSVKFVDTRDIGDPGGDRPALLRDWLDELVFTISPRQVTTRTS